jgi:hypothetical protein
MPEDRKTILPQISFLANKYSYEKMETQNSEISKGHKINTIYVSLWKKAFKRYLLR